MRISVVTVTYNSARTIADTLASVASQTHPQLEHLVIDGASRDDTLRIVRNEGSRVARVISEPDQGIYDAMNKGIALASGDMVGFLNADDVFAGPDSVAALAAEAQRSGASAVYGDLVYVREKDLNSVVRTWHAGAFSPARLRHGWMPPHPTFYARTEVLRRLGGFDTHYRIAADYELMLRCLTSQRPNLSIGYVPRVLVRMRMGGVSNKSLGAMIEKSREDLRAIRCNRIGGLLTLSLKNIRKLPQFLR